jgi:hypothetical protein
MRKRVSPMIAYENKEFMDSPEARSLRVLSEILEPQFRLGQHRVHTTVLFFGSSRINPDRKRSALWKYYWDAEELNQRASISSSAQGEGLASWRQQTAAQPGREENPSA